MSIRIKIAKWLDPGAYRRHEAMRRDAAAWRERSNEWSAIAISRGSSLQQIARQRTSRCNATVRRICDIADAELKRGG